MRIFWVLIIFCFIMTMFAQAYPSIVIDGTTALKKYKPNKFIMFFIYVILILVSGLRWSVGDTGTYINIFNTIPSNCIEYLNSDIIESDRGFYFIVSLIKQFISPDNQIILLVLAIITIGCIGYGLYKYEDDVTMTTFLFITMGCFSGSMNGIRQYVAASLLFLMIPLIEKRKLIPYMICVYLISTIHNSALIFIPLYFVGTFKAWGKGSYFIIGVGIILFLTYNITGPMIANMLGETQYGHYAESLVSNEGGANFLRYVIAFVPLGLSLLRKNIINNMEHAGIFVNFSIINFIVTLLANKFWIYARFCIYFNLFALILLTYCLNNIFEKRSTGIIKMLCIMCYCFFFWYDSLTSGLVYFSKFIKI